MGNRLIDRETAEQIIQSATLVMKHNMQSLETPQEVAAAYVRAVLLSIQEARQLRADGASTAPTGKAARVVAERTLPDVTKVQLEGFRREADAPTGKAAQRLGNVPTGKATQAPTGKAAAQLGDAPTLIVKKAGRLGHSFDTLALVAVIQHGDLDDSVREAFENNGFHLTVDGLIDLGDVIRDELRAVAKPENSAAPTAANIKADLSKMVIRQPGYSK